MSRQWGARGGPEEGFRRTQPSQRPTPDRQQLNLPNLKPKPKGGVPVGPSRSVRTVSGGDVALGVRRGLTAVPCLKPLILALLELGFLSCVKLLRGVEREAMVGMVERGKERKRKGKGMKGVGGRNGKRTRRELKVMAEGR